MSDPTRPMTLHEIHTQRENKYLEKSISDKRIKIDRLRDEKQLADYLKSTEL